MAKDVDLSSKEWCDIVFEGKNKEFGAYVLRSASPARHTRAVVYVLVALLLILGLLILSISGVFSRGEEIAADAALDQELAVLAAEEVEEEIEEEEEWVAPEEPEEIIQPEEVLNEQRVTELLVVQDEEFDDTKEVKDQSEVMETEVAIGANDFLEGTNDLSKEVVRNEVVAEEPAPEPEKVYNIAMVEQKPEFPGGEAAMYKWLGDHISYPAQASEEGVQGRVVVQFEVSKTGAIENVKVVRSRHPALDKEAVRLIKAMPRWQPGRNNGQPVKVTYTLPVTFKLQE